MYSSNSMSNSTSTLTIQSVIIGISFIIIAIIFMLNVIVLPSVQSSIYDKMIILAVFLAVIIPLMLINIYVNQCMINGGCNTFSSAIATIAIILALLYMALFVIKMIKKKRELAAKEIKERDNQQYS